ncbi:uncharacterized protein [Dysidea avara]|uniref:uncharacterized protein n=1 Tax=Dysidea avara TaxID=196820 RepID=UPI00331DC15C
MGLATEQATTYLSITSEAIVDMFGNPIIAINTTMALNATNYTTDATNPVLNQFSLIMNDYQLILSFSETVNASSLNISGISLHPQQDPDSTIFSYRLSSENTDTSSINGPEIVVQISTEDMNAIKLITELATAQNNTYITIDATTINDMVGISVVPITPVNAERAAQFMRDTVGPILQNFTLNLTSEILTLSFNETVNASSVNLNGILLHNSNSSISQIDFVNSIVISNDSHIINIQIDIDILHVIKLMLDLATDEQNTYIEMIVNSVFDLADTDELPANGILNARIPAGVLYPDRTSPQLDNFAVDLSNGTITLNFDEPVLADSLHIPAITFQSVANLSYDGSEYTLTGGYSNNSNGLSIVFNIDEDDLNNIKRDEQLLRNQSTSFIRFTEDMITDMNNNQVVPILADDAEMAILFDDDEIRPRIQSFAINMDNGTLTLRFSETVDVSTLNFTHITLQLLTAVTNPWHQYTLTDGSLISDMDDTSVFVKITDFDLNEIKGRSIASSQLLVALTTTDTLIQDMAGEFAIPLLNNITSIGITSPTDYVPDITHLELQVFDLNLTEEILIMFFSEAVDESTLDVSQITLYYTENITRLSQDNVYTLTNTSYTILVSNVNITGFTGSDSRIVVIKLSSEDLNEIKRREGLAITRRTSYLGITNRTIEDTVGNPVVPIFGDDAKIVRRFTGDFVNPVLVCFDFDLLNHELILTFSETVYALSFNAIAYTLHSTNSTTLPSSYTLTGGTVLNTMNDPVVTILLDDYDTNRIKNLTDLATSEFDTFLTITEEGIKDMGYPARNALQPQTEPMQVKNYTEDLEPPTLDSYVLDMNTGVMSLIFSETVNASSLVSAEIWLQNTQNVSSSTDSYHITDGLVLTQNNPEVLLQLTAADLNAIKKIYNLATTESDTWLYHSIYLITDMANNSISAIPDTAALRAAMLIQDVNRPKLEAFTFNANTGVMTLLFNETVNVNTFMPTAIILQADSDQTTDGRYYRLTGGTPNLENSTEITFNLTISDSNEIKRIPALAVSNETVYLIHEDFLVEDMNTNLAVPITVLDALQVSEFTPDNSSAVLLEVELDLMSGYGVLRLTFDETVNHSTLNISQLMLQNNETDPSIVLTLTGGSVPEIDSTVIEITLSFEDSTELKRLQLCESDMNGSDCYFTILSTALIDMVGNNIEGEDGFPVDPYIPDTMHPSLESFTEFNYVTETVILTFSEVVDISSFLVTGLAFQNFLQTTDPVIPLTGGIVNELQDSHVVSITLTTPDIDTIKRNPTICTRRNTCWLTIAAGSVVDLAGNPVIAVPSDEAAYSLQFIQDMQPPCLEYFDISVQDGTLTLYFNEPVDTEFLRPQEITLQSNVSVDSTDYQITLTGGSTDSPNSREIVIQLEEEDLERIKASAFIKDDNDTFIAFTANLIRDTSFAQVAVKPISDDNATQVRLYGNDTNPPSLQGAHLSLDIDRLILTFSEPVIPETFQFSEIAIQNSLASPTVTVDLAPGNVENGATSNIVVVRLNASDLIELKVSDQIATGIANTVISIGEGVIMDTAGNNNSAATITATDFTIDDVFTTLDEFTLDMNLGILHITFTDIVNTSTFEPIGVQIQDDIFASPGGSYVLISGSTLSPNGYVVDVMLSKEDLDELKFNTRIATSVGDTWLTLRAITIKDIFLQDIIAVTNGNAKQAADVIPDETPPMLESFHLDLDSNTLLLTYTETIDVTTFNVSGITIIDSTNGTNEVEISNLTTFSRRDKTTVQIELRQTDVDRITENIELATDTNNTYIYIPAYSISDQNGNSATGIDPENATQAEQYTIDNVSPTLNRFTLDLNISVLCLTFSETVNAISVDPEQISIQNGPSRFLRQEVVTLSGVKDTRRFGY